jgi:glycosyltransferase involved in cell wall biosynthesis
MVKVGFRAINGTEWVAGINYLRNLLYALSQLEDKTIATVLFIGKKYNSEIFQLLLKNTLIVKTSLFDRMSLLWFAQRCCEKILRRNILFNRLIKKYNIDVLSHTAIVKSAISSCKIINWIADFQHIKLPEMFSKEEIILRNKQNLRIIKESDIILLSSRDAFNDCMRFAPEYVNKMRVLPFVCFINPKIYEENKIEKLKNQYGFKGKYFYLPNQFWQHKNHKTVFEAVNILKQQNKNVLLICSGLVNDYRNKSHIMQLKYFIEENRLTNNIKILGLIDYDDVMHLIRHCVSLINPSLFEGWSSTVEEVKSLGKNVILSDINVHREQNPPASIYFSPFDKYGLSEILWEKWNNSTGGPDFELERIAQRNLQERVIQFAEQYRDIVLEVVA